MEERNISRFTYQGGELLPESHVQALRVFTEDCTGRPRCESDWFACRYAERVGHRETAVLDLLNRLCDDGLLKRVRGSFALTEKGESMLERAG